MSTALPLFDYQAQAADVAAQRERFGLHDEMGIGKTATSIGTMNRAMAVRNIIVCPGMLRANWAREIDKFSAYPLRVCVGKTIHDFVSWKRDRFDTLVTSYEQATKWMPMIHELGEVLDFAVFDEAHYLKNIAAQRTLALLGPEANGERGLPQWAVQTLHVTGTPMANDPIDAYTFLQLVRGTNMPLDAFRHTFFESMPTTYGSKQTVKRDMLPAFQQLLRNNSIARTHKQVGLELPDIFINELTIEGSTVSITNMLKEYPHVEEAIVEALETGELSSLDAPYIATLRRLLGKAKVEPYARLLTDELNNGLEKCVVFCVHDEPLMYLWKHLARHGHDAVAVAGFTPEPDRDVAVQKFMNDPNCRVFLAKIRVAGVGLTLTAAHRIDMLESDWTPAGNLQAIKRVHRYGQTKAVWGRFVTLANSFDVRVNATVARKTREIAAVEEREYAAALL